MNVTSSTGVKQWTYTYEPYGVMKTETKDKNTAPATVMKFAGEQLDATSLYHLRARQYDPAIGRFGAQDPLPAWPAAQSPYAYVGNMPTRLIDPTGMAGEDADSGGTCGSIWCWLKSAEGRESIGCGLFVGGGIVAGGYVVVVGGAAVAGGAAAAWETAVALDNGATIGSGAIVGGAAVSESVPCL